MSRVGCRQKIAEIIVCMQPKRKGIRRTLFGQSFLDICIGNNTLCYNERFWKTKEKKMGTKIRSASNPYVLVNWIQFRMITTLKLQLIVLVCWVCISVCLCLFFMTMWFESMCTVEQYVSVFVILSFQLDWVHCFIEKF